jgi:hypothetical protein
MRKILIVALVLASLGVFVGLQATPANATCVTTCLGWGLYTVNSNGKKTEHPYCRNPHTECTPPKPTTPWQGSASGVNKAFNPSTAYKNK